MTIKQHYTIRIYILICLSVSSSFGFTQNCNTLTLDDITNPGIYSIASIAESDGIRNGPDYAGATIYYPTNATAPFPSIVIVPGYLSTESTIQTWGPFLASHGIVTMTIGTNDISESPYSRKDALLDALITLKEEKTRINSPLIGKLDIEKIAVGGWSMGGGGAQLAAAADTSLKAVIALCPWLDVSLNAAEINHPVPLLIFSGSLDPIAPPISNADIHYDYTPQTTNKLLYEIENAGHTAANNPTGGQGSVGKIALSWLKHHLIGDSCYCPLFLDTPPLASKFMTNVVCPETIVPIIPITSISTKSIFLNQIYPNPCRGSINISVKNIEKQTSYEILSLAGAKIARGNISNKITPINIENLSSGIYIMNLIKTQSSEKIKFIVM